MKNFTLLLFFFGFINSAQPGPNDGTEFNGVDQFILMPDSDNINTRPVDNRTIETYFRVNDASSRQTLYKEGGQVNSIKFIIEGGYLYAGCYKNSGGPGELIYFRKPISNNTWYHVALVLDNASNLSFYLDGVLQDTRPNFFQIPPHPGDFEIARSSTNTRYPDCDTWTSAGLSEYCLDEITSNDPSVNYFGGRVWGFRIWDVVRTAQEIDDNKDILITDTSTSPGDQLIAFLNDDSMNYQDDDGDFDTQDVESEGVLGLNTLSLDRITVYLEDQIVKLKSPQNLKVDTLELFDLTGKSVTKANRTSELPIGQIADGVYILRISNEGQLTTRKVLVR